MIPQPPPRLQDLPAGYPLVAGLGHATVLPDLDFETYSEAGFVWNDQACDWDALPGAPGNKKGIQIVGAAVYATHPSTEILSLKYDLKNGRGERHWKPGDPVPQDLFDHIAAGGFLEAHNSGFEHWIWNHVAVPKLGWPPLPLRQLRCSMAKARAHAMPGALDKLGSVLRLSVQKDADGGRLLKKFSIPRDPSKKDPRRRILPSEDPQDAERLYAYNGVDIRSEAEASSRLPDLSPEELEYWLYDQETNYRGVAMDRAAIEDCIAIVNQAFERYNGELRELTGGQVEKASQLERLKGWLIGRGVYLYTADEDAIDEQLKRDDLDPMARRALELRSKVGSASIKKLFTMRNMLSLWNRLHDLFNYHAARTGRDGGRDVQAQNLPKGTLTPEQVEEALAVIATRSLDAVEAYFGDAIQTISGCLRGLFIAADGHDLIASDYSAIEAVVLACMAGEEWRVQTFREKKDIYLMSAAKSTGNTYEFYADYKKTTGKHHPHRATFGKISELALGYGGWIGAMINFGAAEFFTEPEMVANILRWRDESPAIVEWWGGQFRGLPWHDNCRAEYYGLEGAAIQAILNPGVEYTVQAAHPASRPVRYIVRANILYCILPSGRSIPYHEPALTAATKGPYGSRGMGLSITFMGWNTNPKMGAVGWVRMDTYGPKLAENVVQAVSRDILRDAVIRLWRAGYPVVLRVHDEIVAEILKLFGSIEEFERIMSAHDPLYDGWPIRAVGGWRGRRYRKD